MKLKNLLLFSWKKLWIIILLGFISIILHNAFSALFNTEEAFFFLIAVLIIPLYILIMAVYNLAFIFKKGYKAWKLKIQRLSK